MDDIMSFVSESTVQSALDVCSPTLVQRVAALLDKDPMLFCEGDTLPRGWHFGLFTVSTPQSALRPDGVGGLGFKMPDLGLPRLMMGGRRIKFDGDIIIGSRLVRKTSIVSIVPKNARSGPIAVITIRHEIVAEGHNDVLLTEDQDFIMRDEPSKSEASRLPVAEVPDLGARPSVAREMIANESILFRYCAITFNSHRIHYDHKYATTQEGYPAIVVNGGLPALYLMELFRDLSGKPLSTFQARNVAPMFCGDLIRLRGAAEAERWHLQAENAQGGLCLDAYAT
jgi:3-methylfumaryl-CoA hydratase